MDYQGIPLDEVVRLARRAGEAALEFYDRELAVELKADDTPLTAADRASHEVLAEGLALIKPVLPVLSEEGRAIPFEERSGWRRFWLTDPLDGTKEFIKHNGEFTVNVALIEEGRAVWGVVVAPALGISYWGGLGLGAMRSADGEPPIRISTVSAAEGEGLVVVKSRSHPSPELDGYLAGLKIAAEVEAGSSLKFCRVAEGAAHLYPRFGPTMEWDTAAGQAVLEGAGGRVLTIEGEPLGYNRINQRNGPFVADSGG